MLICEVLNDHLKAQVLIEVVLKILLPSTPNQASRNMFSCLKTLCNIFFHIHILVRNTPSIAAETYCHRLYLVQLSNDFSGRVKWLNCVCRIKFALLCIPHSLLCKTILLTPGNFMLQTVDVLHCTQHNPHPWRFLIIYPTLSITIIRTRSTN